MNKLLFSALFLIPLFSLSQETGEELIYWNNSKRLTWSDYKGNADPSSSAAASTATYLGIEYNFGKEGLTYKITCSFSKNRSWGRHKDDHILSHEQGHFDIAEVFARKLNMKMKSYQFDKNTFKTDLKKIYQDIIDEKERTQNEYDDETNHSINKERQAEWLKKIEKMLDEYKSYSNY